MTSSGHWHHSQLMPKLLHLSHRLLQFSTVWNPPGIPEEIAKSTEYVCMLSTKKEQTSCLRDLHWLPVKQRIHYKILTLTYKSYHGIGPGYLQQMIVRHQVMCQGLRSAQHQDLLVIPCTKSKIFRDRSFAVAAPLLWNAFPSNIRACKDLLTFKKNLKSHLYNQAFS